MQRALTAVGFLPCAPNLSPSGTSRNLHDYNISALRYDNDALRAQIVRLSSQMQDVTLKMSTLFARLDAPPHS